MLRRWATSLPVIHTRARFPRLLSSSTSPPPPPLESDQPPSPPSPPSRPPRSDPAQLPPFSSFFSEIKEKLKTPPTPQRGVGSDPFLPRHPQQPPPSSFDEVRNKLASFRSNSPPPNTGPLSFSALFGDKVHPSTDAAAAADQNSDQISSIAYIRSALRNLPKSDSPPKPPPGPGSLASLLSINPPDLRHKGEGGKNELPPWIFPKDEKPDNDNAQDGNDMPETELLKKYNYDELGEALRKLRPEEKGEFSLSELKSRLAKLQKLEEEAAAQNPQGLVFAELRKSIWSIKQAEEKKKKPKCTFPSLSELMGLKVPSFMLKPPQEHLLENYFHPDHMSSEEKMKLELKRVRDEFKMSESDCGSTRVQVAQLTTKIKHLQNVLHKKDKHSRKGLQEMVQRRKKLLKYLRQTDWDSYCLVLSKLGLRDVREHKLPEYKTQSKSKSKSKSKRKSKSKSKSKLKA